MSLHPFSQLPCESWCKPHLFYYSFLLWRKEWVKRTCPLHLFRFFLDSDNFQSFSILRDQAHTDPSLSAFKAKLFRLSNQVVPKFVKLLLSLGHFQLPGLIPRNGSNRKLIVFTFLNTPREALVCQKS